MGKYIITRKDVEQTLSTRDLVLSDYAVEEKILKETFNRYPKNNNFEDVLLKVALLNQFYSTGIQDIVSVAKNIVEKKIDNDLKGGKPEVVHKIALVEHGDKTINHFSFATKYCSFHQPDKYPIYDNLVYQVLSKTRNVLNTGQFSLESIMDKGWKEGNKDCGYNHYRNIYKAFMTYFGEAFANRSFKEVDNYLWGSRKISLLAANDERINASNHKVYKAIVNNDINTIMNN